VPSQEKRQRQKANTAAAREARAAAERRTRMFRTGRNVAIVVALFAALIIGVSVFNRGGNKNASTSASTTVASTSPTTTPAKKAKLTGFKADPNKAYNATIDTNFGPIVVSLDVKTAPKAASRFIDLARGGFYNGLTWHRVAKDFVIQAGDPTGTGNGGSGNPPIVDNTGTGGYPVGAVAAAKTPQDPKGTFDSQFYIVTGSEGATLPNDYALFGKVTSGIENAKKIDALAPASGDGPPTKHAVINKITITES
jgi:cyclophilin family peptidyl-prolyl cis-trans isomerase